MATSTKITIPVPIIQLINADIAHNFSIVPKALDGNNITFFIPNETLKQQQSDLELILGKSVYFEVIDKAVFFELLNSYYLTSTTSQTNLHDSSNFFESLIAESKAIGVSDIHFECFKETARVRVRVDGKLIEKHQLEKLQYAELVNQIKIKAELDITEKRLPQDGRIHYDNFDIRVSILPTLYGERMVLRILGRDTEHSDLNALGMEAHDLSIYQKREYNLLL